MNWTVAWETAAQNHLAQLWTNAPDKRAVTEAADSIDQQLAANPFAWSEGRDGATRIMVEPPLAVYFDVNSDLRQVRVWAVWRWGDSPTGSR